MWLRFGGSVKSHSRMSIELLLSFGGQEYFYDMRPWERERAVAMVIQNQLRLPPLFLNWQFSNLPKLNYHEYCLFLVVCYIVTKKAIKPNVIYIEDILFT